MSSRKNSKAEPEGPQERRLIDRTTIDDRSASIEFPTVSSGTNFGFRRGPNKALPVELIEFSPRGASVRAPFQTGVEVGTEATLHVAGGMAKATVKAIDPLEGPSCRYGLVFLTIDTYLSEFIKDVRENPDEHDYRWLYRSA
jgi:hypothetical protein